MNSIKSLEIQKIMKVLLNQPRFIKTFIAFLIDLFLCIFSVWISFYLRLGDLVSLSERGLNALFFAVILSVPIFISFGLYKAIFRYSGLYTIFVVSKAISIYGILFFSIISFIGIEGVPRTLGLIQPLLLWILIISWRIIFKNIFIKFISFNNLNNNVSRALVYGAGIAGRQLVRAIQESTDIVIKGFLDDDLNQQGCLIDGKKIFSPNDLGSLIKSKNINLILLALPSISKNCVLVHSMGA